MTSRGFAGGYRCGNTSGRGWGLGNSDVRASNGGTSDWSAGSHAGRGGWYQGRPRWNERYGNYRAPVSPGSGGGAYNNGGSSDLGGAGGGVIRLRPSANT